MTILKICIMNSVCLYVNGDSFTMRRSDINKAIRRAIAFFKEYHFPLPPFAYWTPGEWLKKGAEYQEIRKVKLGWDVTDFGSNDFPRMGRTIFTLRNGSTVASGFPKSYVQKVMYLAEGQKSAVHYHKSKMEDIINQGGGNTRFVRNTMQLHG